MDAQPFVTPWKRSARAAGVLAVVLLAAAAFWGGLGIVADGPERSATVEASTPPGEAGPAGEGTDEPTPVETLAIRPDAESTAGDRPALDTLPDGEHFGFVSSFTGDVITVEPAEFLTGDEARSAAREDGVIGPAEDLPGGFYVRDTKTAELALPVGARFRASMIDNVDVQPREVDAATMAALYAGEADAGWLYGPLEHLPMDLVVEDGEVVRADQRYVP